MEQKGFISFGVAVFLCMLLLGIGYGGYLFMGVLGSSSSVDTTNWDIVDGRTIGFTHPNEWKVQAKDTGGGSEVYMLTISSLSLPGQKVTAHITYVPVYETMELLCNDEARKYAVGFRYLINKHDGYKCVFKDYKSLVSKAGETTAYIYTFHDQRQTSTVTVDVRTPKFSLPDPSLEKKLDTMVDTISFK